MDLYCGVGAIGLALSDRVRQLVGIEVHAGAVDCARRNASAMGVAADFQAGQVVAALKLIGSAAVLGSNNDVFSMSLASTLRCKGREEEFTAACHECVTFDTENPGTRNAGNLAEDVCEICTGNLDRSTFQ